MFRSLSLTVLLLLSGQAMALKPGTVVVYSDSSVEKLLSDDGQTMVWEDDRKRRITRSHNPVIPVLERKDFLGGGGYSLKLVGGDPAALLEAPKGKLVEFVYLRTKSDGRTSLREWQCTAEGKKKRKVLGKSRALLMYHCKRMKTGSKFWARSVKEERTIAYSPRLKLVVDLKRKTRKSKSRKRVAAILSPRKAGYSAIKRQLDKVRSKK